MTEPPAAGSRRRAGTRPTLDVALSVPLKGNRLLVARRPAGTHLEHHWEFPGGKCEPGEEPETAARRELVEETGLVADELEPLLVFVHEYPDRSVRLHVFVAREPAGRLRLDPEEPWVWKGLDEVRRLKMPAANEQILRALRWRVRPERTE